LALPFLGDFAKMTRETDWRSMLRRYNGKGAQSKMAVPLLARDSGTKHLRLKTND
jgi:hypothetical protein